MGNLSELIQRAEKALYQRAATARIIGIAVVIACAYVAGQGVELQLSIGGN